MKRACLRAWFFSGALAAACGFVSATAHADEAEDTAKANVLFKEAFDAYKASDYATACPKYEEVVRLKPGLGARIGLGDCYRAQGKLARAWEVYRAIADDAPTIAKQAKSWADGSKARQRGDEAKKRLSEIEPHLGWITVSVGDVVTKVPSVAVHLDGVVVTNERFGVRLPAERGEHVIDAMAPGKRSFEKSVALAEGAELTVTIPALEDEPPPDKPKGDGGNTGPALKDPKNPQAGGGGSSSNSSKGGEVSVGPAGGGLPDPDHVTPPPPSDKFFSTQRVLGLGLSVVGIGAGVAGAVFGLRAIDKRDESEAGGHCNGNVCDETGGPLRQASYDAGNLSTGFFVGGGVALAAGVALFLTAPRAPRAQTSSLPQGMAISIGPSAILLSGRF